MKKLCSVCGEQFSALAWEEIPPRERWSLTPRERGRCNRKACEDCRPDRSPKQRDAVELMRGAIARRLLDGWETIGGSDGPMDTPDR